MMFALIGNQNCGKTTLFNRLTGANQRVGNFPGVTVEQKIGQISRAGGKNGGTKGMVVDLPGIYSLRPYSKEEIVTRDFLLNEKPDGIINIADATNLERNLYLTLQLIDLHMPMVLALNMMDELRNNGGTVYIKEMEQELGIPVVPISAAQNEGIEELIHMAWETAENKRYPKGREICSPGPLRQCIYKISCQMEGHTKRAAVHERFAAIKFMEGDKDIIKKLSLSENEKKRMERMIVEMEKETGMDRNVALADMRYSYIEKICKTSLIKGEKSKEYMRSQKMDAILTNRFLALPIFGCIMVFIFWMTFGGIGAFLCDFLKEGIGRLTAWTDYGLTLYGIHPVMKSLIIDGILAGVGSVVSFLPIILVLFFFLSLLEDSGYMARVAFIMDAPFRKLGLSGRSVVPVLLGFGCSVPAVMASRTLSSERDRNMTILLVPYVSCSAKIPIYAVFTAAFFPNRGTLVMALLYFGGIALGAFMAFWYKKIFFSEESIDFVMELPNYRFPAVKSVLILMWEKTMDFLERAFTIIFMAAIIIWFMQTFDLRMNVVKNSADSLLGILGRWLIPIFSPLGFTDWRIVTALITGITAKEVVVSTLGVLLGTGTAQMPGMLHEIFTPPSAVSFLVFVLLYTPCTAAIAAIKKEMNSTLFAFCVVVFQCMAAWFAAFFVFQIGSRIFFGG